MEGGKITSPIQIQRYYLAKIENIVEDDREKKALRILEEVLDSLENKRSKELARRVEWLDRYYAIQEAKESKGGPDIEMMACKQYSEIGADRGTFHKRQKAGLAERLLDDKDIVEIHIK